MLTMYLYLIKQDPIEIFMTNFFFNKSRPLVLMTMLDPGCQQCGEPPFQFLFTVIVDISVS
jgi:hypothetical protein